MESILLKTTLVQNHTLQQQVPFVGMDLSWLSEFLKGMVKPVCATAVVFLALGLSFSQKLGLEVEMIIAVLRAFVQLSIIGFVLQFIFNQDNSGWILLAYLFMVSLSSFSSIF
jgi:putative ABC transport system permease protein